MEELQHFLDSQSSSYSYIVTNRWLHSFYHCPCPQILTEEHQVIFSYSIDAVFSYNYYYLVLVALPVKCSQKQQKQSSLVLHWTTHLYGP